jgi:hypothetical protein
MAQILTVRVLQYKQIDIAHSYSSQLRCATDRLYVFSKVLLHFYIKRLKRIFVALTRQKVVEE